MEQTPRRPLPVRDIAVWATAMYVALFAVTVVLALNGGDGSGLEWVGAIVVTQPVSLLLLAMGLRFVALFAGAAVNATLVYVLARRIASWVESRRSRA